MTEDVHRAGVFPIDDLVSPYGLVGRAGPVAGPRGLRRLRRTMADLGSGRPGHGPSRSRTIQAGGCALDDLGLARTTAIAEAAERYAGQGLYCDHVWATAADLGGPVMDLTRLPRCSPSEYAQPDCPVVPFDENASIRWVQGTDIVTTERLWVPAIMACYGMPDVLRGERFWYQISTGYAVHTDPAEALVRAICEVAERDIIAVLWLQRLPLPPLDPATLTEDARYLIRWADDHFMQAHVFDATTDIGVPTAYCLLVAEHDERARQTVGCGCGRTMGAAAEKAITEAIPARLLPYLEETAMQAAGRFSSPRHNASYMAHADRSAAFDFLTGGVDARQPSKGLAELPSAAGEALERLIRTLAAAGMQAIAVDRTTRELADAGLTAVAAIIPDLQPMTFHPLTQFRAHPRLYAAPARLGYRCLSEEELNPWPQPFA